MAKKTPQSQSNDTASPSPAQPRAVRRSRPASTAPDVSSSAIGFEPTEEDIRMRAYHRYLERGGGHGMDFEDWLEAERELKRQK